MCICRVKSLIRKISLATTAENLLFSSATAKMFRRLCTTLTRGQNSSAVCFKYFWASPELAVGGGNFLRCRLHFYRSGFLFSKNHEASKGFIWVTLTNRLETCFGCSLRNVYCTIIHRNFFKLFSTKFCWKTLLYFTLNPTYLYLQLKL